MLEVAQRLYQEEVIVILQCAAMDSMNSEQSDA